MNARTNKDMGYRGVLHVKRSLLSRKQNAFKTCNYHFHPSVQISPLRVQIVDALMREFYSHPTTNKSYNRSTKGYKLNLIEIKCVIFAFQIKTASLNCMQFNCLRCCRLLASSDARLCLVFE